MASLTTPLAIPFVMDPATAAFLAAATAEVRRAARQRLRELDAIRDEIESAPLPATRRSATPTTPTTITRTVIPAPIAPKILPIPATPTGAAFSNNSKSMIALRVSSAPNTFPIIPSGCTVTRFGSEPEIATPIANRSYPQVPHINKAERRMSCPSLPTLTPRLPYSSRAHPYANHTHTQPTTYMIDSTSLKQWTTVSPPLSPIHSGQSSVMTITPEPCTPIPIYGMDSSYIATPALSPSSIDDNTFPNFFFPVEIDSCMTTDDLLEENAHEFAGDMSKWLEIALEQIASAPMEAC